MLVPLQRLVVAPEQFSTEYLDLTPDQQHYLCRVLRLSPGQQFLALDGQGKQWLMALTESTEKAVIVEQQLIPSVGEGQFSVTLAIAIPKGRGFDDLVRQTTEMGVSVLQPLMTERTLHRPSDKKLERWRRIASEATEQAERLWLPNLRVPVPWPEFLAWPRAGQRYICVARRTAPHLLSYLQQPLQDQDSSTITIATGPEGGWTPLEIHQALEAGFYPVSLGPTILRAVTAPLAALSVVMAVLQTRQASDTSD